MSKDGDFMEYGDSGLIPLPDGWFFDKITKQSIDPSGCVYDENGDLIYDPLEETTESLYEKDNYEFYDKD